MVDNGIMQIPYFAKMNHRAQKLKGTIRGQNDPHKSISASLMKENRLKQFLNMSASAKTPAKLLHFGGLGYRTIIRHFITKFISNQENQINILNQLPQDSV